jgi:hypothetical protein
MKELFVVAINWVYVIFLIFGPFKHFVEEKH